MTRQSVRGVRDLFGNDATQYIHITDLAKRIALSYGFEYLHIPIIEFSDLYERSLGNESDIVSKEMYKFQDRSGESITLRPEFTAGIARFIIEHGIHTTTMPRKFFSYGPVFRYDRPQMGRYRQFDQLNYEIFGINDPKIDIECIQCAQGILIGLELDNCTKLELNYIGSRESKSRYRDKLTEYLLQYKKDLSEDSQDRITTNPIRILDSKHENDKKIVQNAPKISDYLTNEDRDYAAKIYTYLEEFNIEYSITNSLVRGMDYYTGLVFEFTTNLLGSQAAIIGGGRYNHLLREMSSGKIDLPAIGYGAGIDRMILMIHKKSTSVTNVTMHLSVIYYTEEEYIYASNIAQKLRLLPIMVHLIIMNGTMGKKVEKANKLNSEYIVICGSNEMSEQSMTIKNMKTGISNSIPITQCISYFQNLIK